MSKIVRKKFRRKNYGKDSISKIDINVDSSKNVEHNEPHVELDFSEEKANIRKFSQFKNLNIPEYKFPPDERKIFVGGLHFQTSENDFRNYFSQFGLIIDSNIKFNQITKSSRGFGFVIFKDKVSVDKVMSQDVHILDNKQIDPKIATTNGNEVPKKIFVGGITNDVTEKDLKNHFSVFGDIKSIDIPHDREKHIRKNYAFISFQTLESVKLASECQKQLIKSSPVDVKPAIARSEQIMMSFVKKQSEMPTNRQYTIPYEWHQPQLYYQMNSYYPPENNPNQPRSNYNHDYGSIYPYYY